MYNSYKRRSTHKRKLAIEFNQEKPNKTSVQLKNPYAKAVTPAANTFIHSKKPPKRMKNPYTKVATPSPDNFVDLSSEDDGDNVILHSYKITDPTAVDTVVVDLTKSDTTLVGKVVIDLTKSDTIGELRSNNALFYSYDPRGRQIKHEEKDLFCNLCKCPKLYCAEKVFGEMCYKHVEHLVAKLGFDVIDTQLMVIQHFNRTYTELVHHKMMWNHISFAKYNTRMYVPVPDCMRLASLRRIIDDVAIWREERTEVVSWGPSIDGEDEDEELPLLVRKSSSDSNDDSSNEVVVPTEVTTENNKRTAIEQASDVGPIFKMIKKYVIGHV